MTSGYLNAPELTAATFVKGWYRSSDIGYQPTPETLVVLGRADDVVVVGGRKMAPEPIEEALRRIPGVRDAAVMGVDDLLDTGVMLVAVEVGVDGTASDLAALIAQVVTPYASGFQILPLAAFPRTETGKIRRETIKALYRDSISRM
jgi:acyl-coenzyme A synthetase/AMP-(fatty) acid ligase